MIEATPTRPILIPLHDAAEDRDLRLELTETAGGRQLKATLLDRIAPDGATGVLQLTLLVAQEGPLSMSVDDLIVALAGWAEGLARAARAELDACPCPTPRGDA